MHYLEEWNLLQEDISDRVERAVPPELPQPPKKKRRTEKQDATSQQRIDSYMSNTFLGRMRATGQLKEAPVSKVFFERYKKKSKKAKKGVKIEPKKEGDKQLKAKISCRKERLRGFRPHLNLTFTYMYRCGLIFTLKSYFDHITKVAFKFYKNTRFKHSKLCINQ